MLRLFCFITRNQRLVSCRLISNCSPPCNRQEKPKNPAVVLAIDFVRPHGKNEHSSLIANHLKRCIVVFRDPGHMRQFEGYDYRARGQLKAVIYQHGNILLDKTIAAPQ